MIIPQQLLAEFEDLLRTMPSRSTLRHDNSENFDWLGRAKTLVKLWDRSVSTSFEIQMGLFETGGAALADSSYRSFMSIIHQAIHDLKLKCVGPLSVSINQGAVFQYFDEVRKKIETATCDIFFVDPYLDAEFVSRYISSIKPTVKIRLLAQEKLSTLRPAVELIRQQNQLDIELRASKGLHDRYVFIDKKSCFQSGASFKDGAKSASTTLTEIIDAFENVLSLYEKSWAVATII